MSYRVLLLFILWIFPLYDASAQNTTEYKLLLFIDNELILREKVSSFKIKYLEKVIDVQYDLASIKYNVVDMDKKALSQSGKVELIFTCFDLKTQDAVNFNVSLDSQELDAGYLILRIYTKTKENKRKFVFGDRTFLYEYESPIGYHLLPRRKGRR